MAEYLELLGQEEILCIEEKYNAEVINRKATDEIQLQYACCLVRSKYRDDIRKGIEQFNDLCRTRHCDQRDFLFHLALAHYKLGDYNAASKFIKRLVTCEPQNSNAKYLERLIDAKTAQDGIMGMAVVGGMIALGGALLGMILAKKPS